MKYLHIAFWAFFFTASLQAQSIEVLPVQDNSALKRQAAKEAADNAAFVEQLIGHTPDFGTTGERANDCPPDLEGYYVSVGDSIEIKVDTFGLKQGDGAAALSISNAGSLQFGIASLDDTTLILSYKPNAGFTGASVETLEIKLSQAGHDTTIVYEIYVRRANRVVVTQSQTVAPESITTFCLGSELDFAKPKNCTRSYDCPDNYDGKGQVISHLSSYDYPDTCLVYYASRFPGVDTVCMKICDDWGVCDEFKIPYIITGDTLSIANLPFFDDFSAYPGPYPTPALWLDKNVYLNYTLANDPPSVGLVTFDGIDRRGDDYTTFSGVGDRLTSKAIDLSGLDANDNVFLRFFLQPKGYGMPPDLADKMRLEFRNADREWVTVGTYDGVGDVQFDTLFPFNFYAIVVDDAQFFHKAFQFRFSATTSVGITDLWHLDYVQLSKNVSASPDFPDIAITELPNSALRNYTAMPWRHFDGHVAEELQDLVVSHFRNHYPDIRTISQSSVTYQELVTGTDLGVDFPIVATGTDNNLEPQTPITRMRTIPGAELTTMINALESIPAGDLRILQTQYEIVPSTQNAEFASNDVVRGTNVFSNYFAHDDGTAEWSFLQKSAQGGEQFAVKFHANVEDEMQAVQFMFPHVPYDFSDQFFNLKIWVGSLDSDPILYRTLLKPYFVSDFKNDTLQGFTTYVLEDFDENPTPVTIPANTDFYVGFEQETAAGQGIPIGFDLQNDCVCNYSNTDGEWVSFSPTYHGSLMIRPVFGEAYNTNSPATETATPANEMVGIFPNPSTGMVHFSLRNDNFQDFKITVFNNLGQLVATEKLDRQFDFSPFRDGVYHLQFVNGKTGERFSQRLILAKD